MDTAQTDLNSALLALLGKIDDAVAYAISIRPALVGYGESIIVGDLDAFVVDLGVQRAVIAKDQGLVPQISDI